MVDVEKTAEFEYIELILEAKDGKIVSCEFYGEGRQVEPLTEPVLFKRLDGETRPRHFAAVERRVKRAFRRLADSPR